MMLWAVAAKKEYATSLWATYQQWRELGAQVRGEKSTSVVFWKLFDEEDECETEGTERSHAKGVMARAYHVFNAAQVDGYEVPVLPRLPETERIERAEQFFNGLNADIREGRSRAFYAPAEDYIQMPPFAVFKKADFRYSVLAHEITHWTGAETRVNRNLVPGFRRKPMQRKSSLPSSGAHSFAPNYNWQSDRVVIKRLISSRGSRYCTRIDGRSLRRLPRRSKPLIGYFFEISNLRRPPRSGDSLGWTMIASQWRAEGHVHRKAKPSPPDSPRRRWSTKTKCLKRIWGVSVALYDCKVIRQYDSLRY